MRDVLFVSYIYTILLQAHLAKKKKTKRVSVWPPFRRIFVTPFSTLAMIKGSLPTNSTTPDRLRSWTKTESEDFPGFGGRTLSKKSFFKRSTIAS